MSSIAEDTAEVALDPVKRGVSGGDRLGTSPEFSVSMSPSLRQSGSIPLTPLLRLCFRPPPRSILYFIEGPRVTYPKAFGSLGKA